MDSPITAWTTTTLQVRYAETDQMGVVYHSNYLIWFEIGRTDFCRKHGFAYREMESQDGLYIMVAEVRCRYKAPARYDDEILVRTCLKGMRRRVLIFGYEVYRQTEDELLAEGETIHVITDREGHPRSLPDKYRDLFVAGPKEPGHGIRDTSARAGFSRYGKLDLRTLRKKGESKGNRLIRPNPVPRVPCPVPRERLLCPAQYNLTASD